MSTRETSSEITTRRLKSGRVLTAIKNLHVPKRAWRQTKMNNSERSMRTGGTRSRWLKLKQYVKSSFPHPVFGETVPALRRAQVDERKKAGLLTSRSSSYFTLPSFGPDSGQPRGLWKYLSLVTAALPYGIHTRFPILLRS